MARRNPERAAKTAAANAIRAAGSNARGRGGRRNTGRRNAQPVDPPVDQNAANDTNGDAVAQPPAQTLPDQPAEPPAELPAHVPAQAPTQIQPNDNNDAQPPPPHLAPQQVEQQPQPPRHGGNHHAPGQGYIRDDGVHIGADGRPVRMDLLGRPSIIPHGVADNNPPSSSSSDDSSSDDGGDPNDASKSSSEADDEDLSEEDPEIQPPQDEIQRPHPEGAQQGILDAGIPPHRARRPQRMEEEPDPEGGAAQRRRRRKRKLPVLERRPEFPDLGARQRDERAIYEQNLADLNNELDQRRHDMGDEDAEFPDLILQAEDEDEHYEMEMTAIKAEDERRMTEWRQYILRWNARERRRRRINRRQDLIRPLSAYYTDGRPSPPYPQMPDPRPSVSRAMQDMIDRANRRAAWHPLNPGDIRLRNQTVYPHGPRFGPHTARLLNEGAFITKRPRTPVRSPRVRESPLNSPDERSRTSAWLREHPEEFYIPPITHPDDIREPSEEPVEDDGVDQAVDHPREPGNDPREPVNDPGEPVNDPGEPVNDPREPMNEPERRGLNRLVRLQELRERAQQQLEREEAAQAAMTRPSPRRSPRRRLSQNYRSHPYPRNPAQHPSRHSPPRAGAMRSPENDQSDHAQQQWDEGNEQTQPPLIPRRHPSRPSNFRDQDDVYHPVLVRPDSHRGQPNDERRPSQRRGVISPDRMRTQIVRNKNQTISRDLRRNHAGNDIVAHQPAEEATRFDANPARITASNTANLAEAGDRAQAIAQAGHGRAVHTVEERQSRRSNRTAASAFERERRRLAESTARLREEIQQRRSNVRLGVAPLHGEEGDADELRDYEFYYPGTEQERQPVNCSSPRRRTSLRTGATPSHIPVLDPETREPVASEQAPSRLTNYYDVVGRPPSQDQGPHGERRRRRRSSIRDPTSRDPLTRASPRIRPTIEHPPEDEEISPRNTTYTRRSDGGGRQRVRFSDPLRDVGDDNDPPPPPSRGQILVRRMAAYDGNDNVVGWYTTTSPLPLGENLAGHEIGGRLDDGGDDESGMRVRNVSGRQRRYPRTPAEAEAETYDDDYNVDDREVRRGDLGAEHTSGSRRRSENEADLLEGIGDENEDDEMRNLQHEDRDDPGDDWVSELDYD